MAGAGAVVARILTQYSDKGSKAAQKDIARLEKKINAFGKKAVASFAVATAASAAFAVKIGLDAVKAASEDLKSQEALAGVLRSTTGATNESIAAVEKYITKQQMLTNVSDTELRASLATLVTVTKDVTSAMDLQSVAVDAAAGSSNDLNSVTKAIAKAQAGNFTSLKKLFPALDATVVKNKQLGKALTYLNVTYKDAAKNLAKKDPITGLKIAFGELSEQLGTALLPSVIMFAEYVKSDVIPLIDSWTTKNKDGLNKALQDTVGKIGEAVDAFRDMYGILGGINAILPFGIGGWLKLAVAISGASSAISLAVLVIAKYKAAKVLVNISRDRAAFEALRTEMGFFRRAATQVLFALRGISAWAARSTGVIAFLTRGFVALNKAIFMTPWGRLALVLVAVGYAIFKLGQHFGWLDKGQVKLSKSAQAVEDNIKKTAGSYTSMDQAVAKYNASKSKTISLSKEEIARNKRLAAMNASTAATAKADAAKTAAIAKGQAALAKMGYKTANDDPIQLEAARLNLVKQGNLAEAARIAMMGKNLELQLEANKALARYNDLLAVLADSKISSEEVLLLSKKWGMTIDATQSYIQTLLAVADQTISDDEITNLAKSWGTSKDQAARYLDFFNYLNDGKLSDAEIAKLQSKWGLTSKEVQIYADLITKASDYVLSDAEIEGLKKNWGLTTDEVVAYIRQLGQPVTFSGTLIDPATQATLGWKSALDALLAYQAALSGKGYTAATSSSSSSSSSSSAAASADATKEAADAAAALADATAEAASGPSAAAIAALTAIAAANPNVPSYLASQESGAIGAASIAAKQKEAARLSALAKQDAQNAAKAAGLAARYGGFVGSSTIDNAAGIGNATSGSGVVVNLVVNGSVSTEQDLVSAVRNGLLATQTNGNSLTLQAV